MLASWYYEGSLMRKTNKIIALALSLASISAYALEKPLKVCTTGDYPPLTYYNANTNQYQGFAITAIEHFAYSQGRKVEFIKTTWPDLNHDLVNKCDIAVGGITKNAKRAKLFVFSQALEQNQKAPIVSKVNEKYFKSFNDIDQKNVTVIENKGGTNEPFAKSHIHQAEIMIVPSNEAAYACLNKYPNKKLVMFTDKIEIQYRSLMKGSILSQFGIDFTITNNPVTEKVFMANKGAVGKKLITEFDQYYQQHKSEFKLWYNKALELSYPEVKASCPF